MYKDPVYGCILVTNNNKHLLVQGRSTGKWSFPKGHPDANEAPIDCAHRELFEETGLKIPPLFSEVCHLATGSYYKYNVRGEYICDVQDPQEIMATAWVTTDEMKKMSVNIDVNTYLRSIRRSNRAYYLYR